VVWEAITANPAMGVAVVDLDGTLHYANPKMARLIFQREFADVVGQSLRDLLPQPWVEERMRIMRRVLETGRPALVRHIWAGRQQQSAIHSLQTPIGEAHRFLVLNHEGEHESMNGAGRYDLVESEVAHLGALDTLTVRELQVLALMKEGLTLDEIAGYLHRSPKTIQSHRDSISRKLNETSRVRLAKIARDAGLELRDAELQRIRMEEDADRP